MELRFEVNTRIEKPVSDVFDAVYNPSKLRTQFAIGRVSGPMEDETSLLWGFEESPGEFAVHMKGVERDRRIVFEWENTEIGKVLQVEIQFERVGPSTTDVRIREAGLLEDRKAMDESYNHCMGWMQLLCHLKEYVEGRTQGPDWEARSASAENSEGAPSPTAGGLEPVDAGQFSAVRR
ncbi:MAG TPA: SRPBCC domain-containing protein [Thermoplasmata archaeon]|nr:SRPBCC domain-containing protein [Thermoplasmata archaeon]